MSEEVLLLKTALSGTPVLLNEGQTHSYMYQTGEFLDHRNFLLPLLLHIYLRWPQNRSDCCMCDHSATLKAATLHSQVRCMLAGMPLSWTWSSGCLQSLSCNKCLHRLDQRDNTPGKGPVIDCQQQHRLVTHLNTKQTQHRLTISAYTGLTKGITRLARVQWLTASNSTGWSLTSTPNRLSTA